MFGAPEQLGAQLAPGAVGGSLDHPERHQTQLQVVVEGALDDAPFRRVGARPDGDHGGEQLGPAEERKRPVSTEARATCSWG